MTAYLQGNRKREVLLFIGLDLPLNRYFFYQSNQFFLTYKNKAKKKNIESIISFLPEIHVTDSTCIGCTAYKSAAINAPICESKIVLSNKNNKPQLTM